MPKRKSLNLSLVSALLLATGTGRIVAQSLRDVADKRKILVLLKEVHALGKPVVLVLLNGSALAVNWANDNVSAIVDAWYPGEEGGTALASLRRFGVTALGRVFLCEEKARLKLVL